MASNLDSSPYFSEILALIRGGVLSDKQGVLALSIRQPFAELILRGIKTVELRSKPTRILGERFWIYASKKKLSVANGQWTVKFADNVAVPTGKLPDWMLELAEQIKLIPPGLELPTGVIVGSAVIEKCEEVEDEARRHIGTNARSGDGRMESLSAGPSRVPSSLLSDSSLAEPVASSLFRWHLTGVERAKTFRKPKRHPQPKWFKPF